MPSARADVLNRSLNVYSSDIRNFRKPFDQHRPNVTCGTRNQHVRFHRKLPEAEGNRARPDLRPLIGSDRRRGPLLYVKCNEKLSKIRRARAFRPKRWRTAAIFASGIGLIPLKSEEAQGG